VDHNTTALREGGGEKGLIYRIASALSSLIGERKKREENSTPASRCVYGRQKESKENFTNRSRCCWTEGKGKKKKGRCVIAAITNVSREKRKKGRGVHRRLDCGSFLRMGREEEKGAGGVRREGSRFWAKRCVAWRKGCYKGAGRLLCIGRERTRKVPSRCVGWRA